MDCGDGLIELINPEILELEGARSGVESCLAYPDYYGYVNRAQSVKIKTLNSKVKSIVLQAEGYLARCNEIDHLNGVHVLSE